MLTFDPSRWQTQWQAYREGGRCWDNSLRQAFRRAAGRFEYLQTWESTRRGWPHMNLIATGDELKAFVEGLGTMRRTFRSDVSGKARTTTFPRGFRRWLGPRAVAAGFGLRVWAEVLDTDNRAGMAGYLLKLSRELTGAAAGPKGEQAPVNAPKGFRRIRASQKLLPPSKLASRGGDWTGRLLPIRTATVDPGPRQPGQARRFEPSSWSRVFAALRQETLEQVERWPDFFDPAPRADPGHGMSEVPDSKHAGGP